jgi:hypothetical protein
MKISDKPLFDKVNKILWLDWDPIGINNLDTCKDEYAGYVPQIFKLVKARADRDIIAEALIKIEHDQMGLSTNHERLSIADKLLSANFDQ